MSEQKVRELADRLVKCGITMGHPINHGAIPALTAKAEEITAALVALYVKPSQD